ncbi:MAG: hypothetical protein PVF33_06420 [Candidatus Latescibacterota bacterium]|jgi:hypothetical protein
MPAWEETVAFRHAPVLLQKVHGRYQRADFITRVDFAHRWPSIHKNWDAVWEKKGAGYRYKLAAHGYYSVVETHTHRYLLYAFYHPQDWSAFWKNPAHSKPTLANQHVHDMEGCLAVVPRRDDPDSEVVEAVVTISHHHFYSFAGRRHRGKLLEGGRTVSGWTEDLDGPIELTDRFAGRGEPDFRFKLYADSGGHAIKGTKKDWGSESRILRYRPSLTRAEAPAEGGYQKETDAYFQTVRYKLVSIFAPGGMWAKRDDRRVFQVDGAGREAFVRSDEDGNLKAGDANPPWGWDDADDRHRPGEIAWDPAHLTADYFAGLREFSREYTHNRYIGIVRK